MMRWRNHAFRKSRRNILGKKHEDVRKRFEVGTELGKGEVAEARLAKDLATKETVALKIINKSCLKTTQNIEEVKAEVAIMERLTGHPNVVALKGTVEDKHRLHLAVEMCMGGEIFDRLTARGNYTEATAAAYMKQILAAVHHCHRNGVVHRDLKPENLMFLDNREDAPIKIVDFGMAAMAKPGQVLTDVLGSPYYIAPEVIRGSYGKECDVWSCGVILYILLAGSPPFAGADTQKQVLVSVSQGQPDMSSAPWPVVSAHAKDLVRRMLTVDPAKRISAEQALAHPWITGKHTEGATKDVAVGGDVVTRLKGYSANNKMKKLALKVVACNLSRKEIQEMKKIFKEMDRDRSGAITFKELREGMRRLGNNIPDDELQKIMQAADVDNSGTIDYVEFITATMQRNSAAEEEQFRAAFELFDKDGSGTITPKELRQALENEGMYERGEVERIMKEVDKDGDGVIDFEEFVDMMRKTNQGEAESSPLRRNTRAVY